MVLEFPVTPGNNVTGRLGVVLISLLFYVLLRNCNKKIRSKCKIVVLLS